MQVRIPHSDINVAFITESSSEKSAHCFPVSDAGPVSGGADRSGCSRWVRPQLQVQLRLRLPLGSRRRQEAELGHSGRAGQFPWCPVLPRWSVPGRSVPRRSVPRWRLPRRNLSRWRVPRSGTTFLLQVSDVELMRFSRFDVSLMFIPILRNLLLSSQNSESVCIHNIFVILA